MQILKKVCQKCIENVGNAITQSFQMMNTLISPRLQVVTYRNDIFSNINPVVNMEGQPGVQVNEVSFVCM